MLTREAKRNYVNKSFVTCPYCGSREIEAIGGVELDGKSGTQRITCQGCEKSWYDVYRLIDILEE